MADRRPDPRDRARPAVRSRTRFVFAITRRRAAGTFSLARFREVLEHARRSHRPARRHPRGAPSSRQRRCGSVRDGKLYAAFDDGGDPRQVGDAASLNGKILRLNADGTTPDDQAGATPIYSTGSSVAGRLRLAAGDADVLWVADRGAGGITRDDRIVRRRLRGPEASPARRGDCQPHGRRCPRRSPSTAAACSRDGRQPVRRVRRRADACCASRFDRLEPAPCRRQPYRCYGSSPGRSSPSRPVAGWCDLFRGPRIQCGRIRAATSLTLNAACLSQPVAIAP